MGLFPTSSQSNPLKRSSRLYDSSAQTPPPLAFHPTQNGIQNPDSAEWEGPPEDLNSAFHLLSVWPSFSLFSSLFVLLLHSCLRACALSAPSAGNTLPSNQSHSLTTPRTAPLRAPAPHPPQQAFGATALICTWAVACALIYYCIIVLFSTLCINSGSGGMSGMNKKQLTAPFCW